MCRPYYLRWMYGTTGLSLWGSVSSESNAGMVELVTGFLEMSERHSSSKYLPHCVFSTDVEHAVTQSLIRVQERRGAHEATTVKLSAPSHNTGISLHLGYEVLSSLGEARCPFVLCLWWHHSLCTQLSKPRPVPDPRFVLTLFFSSQR